jgi:hypothetical protein
MNDTPGWRGEAGRIKGRECGFQSLGVRAPVSTIRTIEYCRYVGSDPEGGARRREWNAGLVGDGEVHVAGVVKHATAIGTVDDFLIALTGEKCLGRESHVATTADAV